MNCFLFKVNITRVYCCKSEITSLNNFCNCSQIMQLAIFFFPIHFWNNIKCFDNVRVCWNAPLFISNKSRLQGPRNYICFKIISVFFSECGGCSDKTVGQPITSSNRQPKLTLDVAPSASVRKQFKINCPLAVPYALFFFSYNYGKCNPLFKSLLAEWNME